MEELFTYNSYLSSGLGARHLSISKSKKGNFYVQEGTPMSPSKKRKVFISESEEAEIREMVNGDPDNADYITNIILR